MDNTLAEIRNAIKKIFPDYIAVINKNNNVQKYGNYKIIFRKNIIVIFYADKIILSLYEKSSVISYIEKIKDKDILYINFENNLYIIEGEKVNKYEKSDVIGLFKEYSIIYDFQNDAYIVHTKNNDIIYKNSNLIYRNDIYLLRKGLTYIIVNDKNENLILKKCYIIGKINDIFANNNNYIIEYSFLYKKGKKKCVI